MSACVGSSSLGSGGSSAEGPAAYGTIVAKA
eukprot:CAMPEP_0203916748 /NCGR_PEP_ID=MMETSP0359-20131031/57418_1 /ASSEMBLY_ACC=CAM_ASM_000338 /TAXON_ID=268821 /ORGANISM="Scrippsiella Hangoei, Strain SHTV-5" /LENGTH=30 /DNA_ID= /DNA_START= /DNA_END= /DNA_ORIENTATION=